MPNYFGRRKFPDLNQSNNSHQVVLQLGYCRVQNPIQAERNLPVLIKFESGMKLQVVIQAFRVWIPLTDTFQFFLFKSTLVFDCLLFCKINVKFLTSIIHIFNHAKSNWICRFRFIQNTKSWIVSRVHFESIRRAQPPFITSWNREKWETHMKGIYCENDAGKIRKSHFQSLVLESSCSALSSWIQCIFAAETQDGQLLREDNKCILQCRALVTRFLNEAANDI